MNSFIFEYSRIMEKVIFRFAVLALLLLNCCNSENPSEVFSEQSEKYGGIFSYNETGSLKSLFPPRSYFQSEIQVISYIVEPLVKMLPDMSIAPCLAESWEINDSGTEYIFHLRKGVYFHDSECFSDGKGRELVANDVVECFKVVCQDFNGNNVSQYFRGIVKGASKYFDNIKDVEGVSGIEAIDDHTLKITLIDSYSSFLPVLSNDCLGIYPPEYLTTKEGNLDFTTVGTGPFQISTYKENNILILAKNNNYWNRSKEGETLPYLSGIKISFEKERIQELKAFKNQVLSYLAEIPISENEIRDNSDGLYQVEMSPIMGTKFLGMYMPHPTVQNRQFRRALQYAIDKDLIVDSLMNNKGIPAKTGIIPSIFSDYKSAEGIGYELDRTSARHSLELAGLDRSALSEIGIITTSREADIHLANALQKMIKDNLGISMSVKYYHPDEYYSLIRQGKAQLFIDGYTGDYPSPENFLFNLFYGKYLTDDLTEYSGFNLYRYKNPFFDNLIDSARYASRDGSQARFFQKAEKMLMQDAAVIPLYYYETEFALNERVKNFKLDPLNLFDLSEVYFTSQPSQ